MNYPQQPGYPEQQPGYAPQYGQQPPPQGYAQQFAPATGQGGVPAVYQPQPPQQYQPGTSAGYPNQQVQVPQPPMPAVTLEDFYDQPASGGQALSFEHPGTSYTGVVVRSVTKADISPQTNLRTGEIARYNDGRVKLVMKIPLQLTVPHPAYPEGTGVLYLKGSDRGELVRAMEAAGIQVDPATGNMPSPRAGDMMTVTYTHDQPMGRGMNPMKVKRIEYSAGNGIAPSPVQTVQATVVQSQYAQPQQAYQVPAAPQQYQVQQPPLQYQLPQAPPQQPQYAQPPAMQMQVPQVDPAAAYAAATGMPYMQMQPTPGTQYQPPPQQFPTAAPAAPGSTPGAPATVPASPSNPPADWPSGVPFIPGMTPDMAAIAAQLQHPLATGQAPQ